MIGYKAIASSVREQIESGALKPGDRAPSQSELMAEYGVAQTTAVRAMALLRDEGWIVAKTGKGSFVRDRTPITRNARQRFYSGNRSGTDGLAAYFAESATDGSIPSVKMLELAGPIDPPDWVAKVFGNGPEPVLKRYRLYLRDGDPDQIATTWIPWSIAAGTAMTEENSGPGGVYARLEEHGYEIDRFTEQVSARLPTNTEVTLLDLTRSEPVIEVCRFAHDGGGQVIEICDQVKVASKWNLIYEWEAT